MPNQWPLIWELSIHNKSSPLSGEKDVTLFGGISSLPGASDGSKNSNYAPNILLFDLQDATFYHNFNRGFQKDAEYKKKPTTHYTGIHGPMWHFW